MTLAQLSTFAVALFAIANPIGTIGVFLGLTADQSNAERNKTAVSTFAACTIIFLLFIWTGDIVLAAFGISLAAFQAAGGFIVVLVALSMLNAKISPMQHNEAEAQEAQQKSAVGVVPLAIPILAGPGAITTIIVHSNKFQAFGDRLEMSAVGVGISLSILISYLCANFISRVLGAIGINIATRLMGLVLAAIGFDIMGEGVRTLLGLGH